MRKTTWFGLIWLACSMALGEEAPKPTSSEQPSTRQGAEDPNAQLQQKLAELESLQAEIARLRVAAGAAPRQILIRVKMLEISRTKLHKLGYDLNGGAVAALLNRSAQPKAEPNKAEPGTPKTKQGPKPAAPQGIGFATLSSESELKETLKAWQKEGALVRVLGEPTIVTVSGRPAFFRSGGEFPVLHAAPQGAPKTEHRFFGTQLSVTPMLLADGRVRLELRPSVSELDDAKTIVVQGIKIPGLRVREIDTGVELSPGQTFAISGFRQVAKPLKQSDDAQQSEDLDELELLVLASVDLVDAIVPTARQTSRTGHDETPR